MMGAGGPVGVIGGVICFGTGLFILDTGVSLMKGVVSGDEGECDTALSLMEGVASGDE